MKNNLRRLSFILKMFNAGAFYACAITDSEVSLQGKFNPAVINKLKSMKFHNNIDNNGYLIMHRYNYNITLTN